MMIFRRLESAKNLIIFFVAFILAFIFMIDYLCRQTAWIMRRKEQLNSIIEICPVRNVIARFGNKWALLVILVLSENEPIRFNDLGRQIPDISSRVLSSTLRTLEADGLVDRKYFQEEPPRVEYSLTETGRSLVPIIVKLTEWAQKNMRSIIEHRRQNTTG